MGIRSKEKTKHKMKTSRLFSVFEHGRQPGGVTAMQTTHSTHNVTLLVLKYPFIFSSRSGRVPLLSIIMSL